MKIGLRVLARPVPDQLPTIYRTLGENYLDRVLPSIIHETLKAVVAQYNASQLITQREVSSKVYWFLLTIGLFFSVLNHPIFFRLFTSVVTVFFSFFLTNQNCNLVKVFGISSVT